MDKQIYDCVAVHHTKYGSEGINLLNSSLSKNHISY